MPEATYISWVAVSISNVCVGTSATNANLGGPHAAREMWNSFESISLTLVIGVRYWRSLLALVIGVSYWFEE